MKPLPSRSRGDIGHPWIVEINMDSNKLNTLTQYLAMGWALVPLHHVKQPSAAGHVWCSCRMGEQCKSAGKHPRLSAWQLESNLVRTEAALLAWPAETNWGLATGRASSVWALDVDPKNGGLEGLGDLSHAGVIPAVVHTRTHITGSNGYHFIYRMPADFVPTNRTGALPPGIDVRGDGGQIVLPPSVSGVGRYMVDPVELPVNDAPAALLDLIRPLPVATHVPRDIMARVDPGGRYASYARSAVDGELRSLRETHSSRNSRAWAAAVRIIELAHAPWSELDIDDEYDGWREAGHAHPDGVDVPPTELDAVWRSALRHMAGREAAPPPDKPWPPRGDVDLLDFLAGPVASPTAVGPTNTTSFTGTPLDPFARIPNGARGGSVGSPIPIGSVAVEPAPEQRTRIVDLGPFLDGTYEPPQPSRGGWRDDGAQVMYPGRWHTVVALTGAGKSWFAVWNAVDEMRRGSTVLYAHFEESSPAGTLERMRSFGLSADVIAKQLIWLDCTYRWKSGEYSTLIAQRSQIPDVPVLGILDGINAACSQHGWPVDKPESVGQYREEFVTPMTREGTTVLSLGHPPKARDRQQERHGFGSTAWLDEVDGVGFRLEAAKRTPIRKGRDGYSALYVVKDRYGAVEQLGQQADEREAGWYYVGGFHVDSSPERPNTIGRLSTPARKDVEALTEVDPIDTLGESIHDVLVEASGREFGSAVHLSALLRAAGVHFDDRNLRPAIHRLESVGRMWIKSGPRGALNGKLKILEHQDQESTEINSI
jgi:hypothetical protein